jgi:hypothetical protein
MRIVTRIRVAICSMMLACNGALSGRLRRTRRAMPRPAKRSSPLRPLPFDQAG